MSAPIAIFYHCLFCLEQPDNILESALEVVHDQMFTLQAVGLEQAAQEIHCGINGEQESVVFGETLLPQKATKTYHTLASRGENLTLVMLENWVKTHPGWKVLYFHAKGATHKKGSSYGEGVSRPWRIGMMNDLINNWRQCVELLNVHDIVCCHWMWNMADGTQHIPAGNFVWINSDFAARLPSIYLRDRIKMSGIAAYESRYEAEVYWGNGPRPNVFSFRPHGGGGVP
jgi:hypothetical protein